MKTAVIFINMGGPENLSEVRGFIRNLFRDSHIISLPTILRFTIAEIISGARAPKVRQHYELIGGGSPLKKWTKLQAQKTSEKLNDKYPETTFFTAYSYSHPKIDEIFEIISKADYDRIIAMPLYPQYSDATLGSIYADLARANKRHNPGAKLTTLPPFYEEAGYINASIESLSRAMTKINRDKSWQVVFTAHALPQSLIDKGDPYGLQVDKTIYQILQKYPLENYSISFQSKIGPVKWMQPSTIDTVKRLGQEGIEQVVVVPIGFVCDHIETLYELDIELTEIAKDAGIRKFIRADAFNDGDLFIAFLAKYLEQDLK